MSSTNGQINLWLLRHGQTEWSKARRYTGLTDLPLTPVGRQEALAAKDKLSQIDLQAIFSSPLTRAQETSQLADVGAENSRGIAYEVLPQAHEWGYGKLEGISSFEYGEQNPDFDIWEMGPPQGETLKEVADRADAVIDSMIFQAEKIMSENSSDTANILLVAHGHFIRIITARFLGEKIDFARNLALDTASLSQLRQDHKGHQLIKWNL